LPYAKESDFKKFVLENIPDCPRIDLQILCDGIRNGPEKENIKDF